VTYKRVKMTKAIPVRLDAALLDRIHKLSERMGEPQSTIMRIAMRVGLDGLEKAFAADPQTTLSSLLYPSRPDEGVIIEDKPKPKKKTG